MAPAERAVPNGSLSTTRVPAPGAGSLRPKSLEELTFEPRLQIPRDLPFGDELGNGGVSLLAELILGTGVGLERVCDLVGVSHLARAIGEDIQARDTSSRVDGRHPPFLPAQAPHHLDLDVAFPEERAEEVDRCSDRSTPDNHQPLEPGPLNLVTQGVVNHGGELRASIYFRFAMNASIFLASTTIGTPPPITSASLN
jgi:hypothetical protein